MEKFDIEQLKAWILDAWRDITKEEIQNSIGCWKKRLRLIVQEDGGHIEHLPKQWYSNLIPDVLKTLQLTK